jgi:dTDP-4-dehydrorhamnose reductase
MTPILLLGRHGQVGRELEIQLAGLGPLVALGHDELDLADAAALRAALERLQPALVVNAAAYTQVDRAEAEPAAAAAVNSTAPAILARHLAARGGALIHYSTDYVFDGRRSTPYTEDDAPNPLNVYGASKLAGERAIAASGVAHLILRTSWVYSAHGANFVSTIRRLAQTQRTLEVVSDQTGSPTWARTIARTTRLLLERCAGRIADCQGLYHLAAAGHTTRYGLAARIVALMAQQVGDRPFDPPALSAVDSSRFPAPAARPAYSALATGRLESRFGITLPGWEEALAEYFRTDAD